MTNPITPEELASEKAKYFPDAVIECFNRAIALNFNGTSSTVVAKNVRDEIAEALNIDKSEVSRRRYLDVEPIYRDAGFDVKYVRPDYTESFDSYFLFTIKK